MQIAFLRILVVLVASFGATMSAAQSPSRSWDVRASVFITGDRLPKADYLPTDVRGALLLPDGRVLVADAGDHRLVVLDSTGMMLGTIGRQGQGPDDFLFPCCLAVSPAGTIWVKDFGNRRVASVDLSGQKPRIARYVRIGPTPAGFLDALSWTADGKVIDLQAFTDSENGGTRLRLFAVSSSGEASPLFVLPAVDSRETADFTVRSTTGASTFQQPFGPRALYAIGAGGQAVIATSGRYVLRWLDPTGREVRQTSGTGTPPLLSARERANAQQAITSFVRRSGLSERDLPFGVPQRKAILLGLSFDADGRLWVRRSNADGAENEADVYDPRGVLVAVAKWPANMRLHFSSLRGSSGVASVFGADGAEDLVIVRLY